MKAAAKARRDLPDEPISYELITTVTFRVQKNLEKGRQTKWKSAKKKTAKKR